MWKSVCRMEDSPLPSFRNRSGVYTALTIVASLFVAIPAGADEKDKLDQAVRLYENGDFLAAQEAFAGIDRTQLTPDQQQVRDDYLQRVQVALTMYEKALRDLEDAESAIAAREYDRAEELLNRVLSNEYAAEALRRAASAHLRDLNENQGVEPQVEGSPSRLEAVQAVESEPESPAPARPAVETAAPPASADAERARVLTREGQDLVRAGRYEEATRRFEEALTLVPGYPDAAEGLRSARQHEQNIHGSRAESLAERVRREDSINWQRTVVQYRDAESTIRKAVSAGQFEEAHQVLVRAAQLVEAGRQFADPPSEYDGLRAELEGLKRFVRDSERTYNEQRVAETRREVERQRSERIRQVEENRARQVESLMEQAAQHRKDGDLDEAIKVLRQVTVIDPKYTPARWMLDTVEDQREFRRAKRLRDDFYDNMRGALNDVEEAKIPWYQDLTYGNDWVDIIARPTRSRPGQSRPDRLLMSALDRPITVDFQRTPFHQVIEQLAEAQKINVVVNWSDLAKAGVERVAPIDLTLPREITLKKALTEVLDQAGAGVALDYDIADGVLTVATQATLEKETVTRVYDITDLLMEVPNFTDAPMIDLRNATPKPQRVSENAAVPWRYGDDDDDEAETDPDRASRVRHIMDVIMDTVAPHSWRERGGAIGSIKEINGQLVVTQNAASQRQITGLLDRLREERAIQVSVEALFITVSSHYLEEMGIDLDIIFNAGNAGFDFLDSGSGPVTDPVLGNRLLLPRTFSRLGFTPAVPVAGQALTPGATPVQPFTQPFLIPQQGGGGGSQTTPIPVLSNVLALTDPSNLPSDVPGSFGGQAIAPALSVFGSFLDNIQVDFLIRATQADSRTTVLTAPRLVVFNGASAWVAVTIQQNFISQLQPVVAQGAVAQAPITGTIDAGASLFVRATVTADKRYVMMLLAPGVTRLLDLQTFQFSGGTGANQAFIQLPTLSSQRIQTMVSVPDGGTLLIGGQKLASETEVEAGVPILSKIPLLKRLYSSRSMIKDEQTLLILVKPKILIHSEQEELAFPSFSQR